MDRSRSTGREERPVFTSRVVVGFRVTDNPAAIRSGHMFSAFPNQELGADHRPQLPNPGLIWWRAQLDKKQRENGTSNALCSWCNEWPRLPLGWCYLCWLRTTSGKGKPRFTTSAGSGCRRALRTLPQNLPNRPRYLSSFFQQAPDLVKLAFDTTHVSNQPRSNPQV